MTRFREGSRLGDETHINYTTEVADQILQSAQVTGKTSSHPEVVGGQIETENRDASNPVTIPQEAVVRKICLKEDRINSSELQKTLTAFAGRMEQNSKNKIRGTTYYRT